MSTIREFAKSNAIPMTAVKCSPHFDDKKNRVAKGPSIPHKDWKKKGKFEVSKTTETLDGGFPSMWMMDLKKAGMYVIDIDVKDGKTAQEIVLPNAWEELMRQSEYVVQTGSGGVHFYFKVPALEEGWELHQKTKVEGFEILSEPESGDIDFLVDQVIVEGSQYEYKGTTYKYEALKGVPQAVSVNESLWKVAKEFIVSTPETRKKYAHQILNRTIEDKELAEHLDNIPNTNTNWNEWYTMGQTLFNVLGEEGRELFDAWSQKCPQYSHSETRKLYDGLRDRQDGNKRTLGSILFMSRQSNESAYDGIRRKYSPLSYGALKSLFEVNHFFVEEPKPIYVRATDREVLPYTPKECSDLLKTWKFERLTKKGEPEEIDFFSVWSKDNTKRTYKRIGFYPDASECPVDVYNCFMKAEASFLPSGETVDLEPILHHIRVMAGNETIGSDFILDYFAQIVQYPAVLMGIAILLYGDQGVGKDIIVNWFGESVLGLHQYYMIGKASKCFGTFNSDLEGKLLIHCDEVDRKTTHENADDLKRMITCGRIRIEGKGRDAKSNVKSFCRFFFTTNNMNALKVEDSNRRYAVFRSSEEHICDASYFNRLTEYMKRPEVIRAFYDFLMARDISKFHHTNIPKNELYREMKRSSMDSILQWVLDTEEGFMDEEDGTPIQNKTTDWLQMYNSWAVANNVDRASITAFGSRMSELANKRTGISRQKPQNISKITIDRPAVLKYLTDQEFL